MCVCVFLHKNVENQHNLHVLFFQLQEKDDLLKVVFEYVKDLEREIQVILSPYKNFF